MSTTVSPPAIRFENVSFAYSADSRTNGAWIYDSFSFEVPQGAIMGVMGASGSGKSTLAKLMAGIVRGQKGNIRRSRELERHRDVIYMDQHPMNSVFPWQNVRENLSYPLEKLEWNGSEACDRVNVLLNLFHLDDVAESYPAKLSGGELQRLALARCFSWKPRLVILDEAFAALDRKTKEGIQSAIVKIVSEEGVTLVLATHNIADVLSTCNRCVVIGDRPVVVLASLELGNVFSRDRSSVEYQAAETKLLELVRDGTL